MFAASAFLALIISVLPEASAEAGAADSGDIGWVLVCSALVFIMSPGVALFYGGMIRKQSMTSVMAQTAVVMGIMTVSWITAGYTIAFSGDSFGLAGNLDKALLIGTEYGDTVSGIPELEFVLFQMMFALITASIVLGACMERVRFNAIAVFIAVWSVLVYAPMAHWVWGGGLFDQNLVVLDFAGGTVVHICAATTGLVLAAFVGGRSDRVIRRGHSMPLVFIGFAMLWFGWLGFNGGSGLSADITAVNAVVTTMAASAAGMLSWAVVQYMHAGHTGSLGLITGALSGLVAITPAAGYVGPGPAIIIGAAGGVVCYFGVLLMRSRSGVDDALDVFGVHGTGAIWGAAATGIFADPAMVSPGYEGLIYGSADLFAGQIAAVLVTIAFCAGASYLIIAVISKFMRVRLSEEEEAIGADISEHGEPSYII
ncbi:MAG: ammonium transporter [Candidatus Methanomethylophilaceae archaeon]|nr:ammonium transporter [Candidatus Methanomethylophilaceae archaeon]